MVSLPSRRQQAMTCSSASALCGGERSGAAEGSVCSGDGWPRREMTGVWAMSVQGSKVAGTLRRRGLDRVFGNDVEGQLHADIGVQLDLHLVLAEGLDRLAGVGAAVFHVDAGRSQLLVDVVRRDGAEQLAAFAGLHRDGDAG